VIVIGSDMAGETVADFASVQDMNVLLLEAGGMLFPTATCRDNMSRRECSTKAATGSTSEVARFSGAGLFRA
jgi:choline dehydrogenase-like flavoprotein